MTVDMMKLVFARLVSPEERNLRSYVHANGGVDSVSKDDGLLQEMLDNGGPKLKQVSLFELQKDIKKNVDDFLKEDAKVFESKFQLVKTQLQDMKDTVQRETDRVIDFLKAGPQERIRDRVSCIHISC